MSLSCGSLCQAESSEKSLDAGHLSPDVRQRQITDFFKREENHSKMASSENHPTSSDKKLCASTKHRSLPHGEKPRNDSGSVLSGESSKDFDTDSHENSDLDADLDAAQVSSPKEEQTPAKKRKVVSWGGDSMEDYLSGYPHKEDNKDINDNKLFYFNEIPSKPNGDFIDKLHKEWFGDHKLLESHHGFIQWLFPIREKGMNWSAQPLQLHEAKAIQADRKARHRVLHSYKMMLDFYGIKLVDSKSGQVARAANWQSRFQHLNRSFHNYLRITRILKSLGELGFEHLKAPLVQFLMQEAIVKKTIPRMADSCRDHFVYTLRNDDERKAALKWITQRL